MDKNNNKFNENDIRPEKYNEIVKQAHSEDISFLIGRKNEFVEVECPSCKKHNLKTEFTKDGFEFVECENCGMLYMSPRPNVELLSEFYKKSKSCDIFNKYVYPSSQEIRREKIFKPRVQEVLKFCKKYSIPTEKIIEIGTGFGTFCEEMVKTVAFKEVVGVEVSDSLAETCESLGFRLYNGFFEDLEINEKFNIAVAFEVLEHIFNPEIFLKKTASLLNENAVLILSFPAWSGFDNSILREYARAVCFTHLNYFTEESITLLLNKTGFDVLEITTPGELDVDIVRKEILTDNVKVPNFIKRICVDEFETKGKAFQTFLQENNLSSHMMVVARKK